MNSRISSSQIFIHQEQVVLIQDRKFQVTKSSWEKNQIRNLLGLHKCQKLIIEIKLSFKFCKSIKPKRETFSQMSSLRPQKYTSKKFPICNKKKTKSTEYQNKVYNFHIQSNLKQKLFVKNYIRKKPESENSTRKCKYIHNHFQIENLQEQKQVLKFQLQNHKKDIQFISNLQYDRELEIQVIRKSFQVQLNQHQRNSHSLPLENNKEYEKRQISYRQEIDQLRKQLNDQKIQNKKLKNMYESLQESLQEINQMQKLNYSNQLQELTTTFQQSQKQKQSYRTDLSNTQKLFNQLSTKKAKQIIQLTQKYEKAKEKIKFYEKEIE